MDGAALGWIGAIAGTLLGVGGGVIGTYFGITRTSNGAERALLIRFAIIAWLAVIALAVLMAVVPAPFTVMVLMSYAIALPLAIRYVNRRQAELRSES